MKLREMLQSLREVFFFFHFRKRESEDVFLLPWDLFRSVWYSCIIGLAICLRIKTKANMTENRNENYLLLGDILKLLAQLWAQPLNLLLSWINTFSCCSNYLCECMPHSCKYPNWCKSAQNPSPREIHRVQGTLFSSAHLNADFNWKRKCLQDF